MPQIIHIKVMTSIILELTFQVGLFVIRLIHSLEQRKQIILFYIKNIIQVFKNIILMPFI